MSDHILKVPVLWLNRRVSATATVYVLVGVQTKNFPLFFAM